MDDLDRLLLSEVEREDSLGQCDESQPAVSRKKPIPATKKAGRKAANPPRKAHAPKAAYNEKFKQVSLYLSRSEYFAIEDKVRARKEGRELGAPVQHQVVREYMRGGLIADGYLPDEA